MNKSLIAVSVLLASMTAVYACEEPEPPVPPVEPPTEPSGHYQPMVGERWQWQLQGTINTSYDADVYDLDLYDTPDEVFTELKDRGISIICYYSAGTYEEWRDDAYRFTAMDKGDGVDGWAGETWVDVRSQNVRDIMEDRLIYAASRGCDAVEPDNVDAYANNPGLDFTQQDQIDYNIWTAETAHSLGLGIGLKNDLDDVEELVSYYDFAVNEQCFQYNECDMLQPFIEQGKPVFNAEYKRKWKRNEEARADLCADANERQFSTLILNLNLNDKVRYTCD